MDNPIRSLVFGKFSSITEFAEAIHWPRGKASRIVNLQQNPDREDMKDMIALFDVPEDKVAPLFFGELFT